MLCTRSSRQADAGGVLAAAGAAGPQARGCCRWLSEVRMCFALGVRTRSSVQQMAARREGHSGRAGDMHGLAGPCGPGLAAIEG